MKLCILWLHNMVLELHVEKPLVPVSHSILLWGAKLVFANSFTAQCYNLVYFKISLQILNNT